jgi:hypothetical protein
LSRLFAKKYCTNIFPKSCAILLLDIFNFLCYNKVQNKREVKNMKTIAMVLLTAILIVEWVLSMEKDNAGRMFLNFSKVMLLIEIFKYFSENP